MHNDRIQGILFDQSAKLDLRVLSATQRHKRLLKSLVKKYGIQRWHLRSTDSKLPPSQYIVVREHRDRNKEIMDLAQRLKVRD